MRKLFIVLAVLFTIIGIAFAIFPFGTLGVLPIGIAILFSILAYVKSNTNQKKAPKWLMIISGFIFFVIIGKSFMPDEVANDPQFEQKKLESNQENLKDLESIE